MIGDTLGRITATLGIMATSTTSPAVGRALDILTHLAHRTAPVSAAAIGRDLGIPRSSTYHVLTVLAERDFVLYLPEARGYTLGSAAHRLGSAYTPHEAVERLARPVLRALADKHGLTVHLGILQGRNTLYLLKEEPPAEGSSEPRLITATGVLLPAHLTANGRAILAYMPSAQVAALFTRPTDFTTRTGRGPRSVEELLGELAHERAQGYGEEVELVGAGLRSVGVTIFDLHGNPIAAVSATWRTRVLPRQVEDVVAVLREGAATITQRLAGQGAGAVRGGGPPRRDDRAR